MTGCDLDQAIKHFNHSKRDGNEPTGEGLTEPFSRHIFTHLCVLNLYHWFWGVGAGLQRTSIREVLQQWEPWDVVILSGLSTVLLSNTQCKYPMQSRDIRVIGYDFNECFCWSNLWPPFFFSISVEVGLIPFLTKTEEERFDSERTLCDDAICYLTPPPRHFLLLLSLFFKNKNLLLPSEPLFTPLDGRH